jgi:16S rRNA G966 N2-methylase RsmD
MTDTQALIDPLAESALFDLEAPPPVSLADKFGVAPLSVLDCRSGLWQDRKARWSSLGMESELGRGGALTYTRDDATDPVSLKLLALSGTSLFDPVLCELAYRWHTRPGDRILDPFAGGSVRGIVASTLARWYVGIDIRTEQVEANEAQAHLGSDIAPRWIQGDSARLSEHLDPADEFDLVFSCPPYADLEVYSDNPRDLSTMPYDEFRDTHAAIIASSTARLRSDRFAAWVISDVRDKRGAYRGLVADTIRAFESAGLTFHNDGVILNMTASAGLRAERPFRATRKLTRVHQHLLVFVKGDAKRATQRLEEES